MCMIAKILKTRNLQIKATQLPPNFRDVRVDFVGIGVQKAATNWLFACLTEHPEIRGPIGRVNKELHFFNRNYDLGYVWYHSKFEFGPWKTGEYSPLYFADKNVPERIYHYHPQMKMILTLRNPIDRAFSQHRYQVMNNRLPRQLYDFEAALPLNPTYIEYGQYASQLERFWEFFDRRVIHIILTEDLRAQPEMSLRQLYQFLGVDDSFSPSYVDKQKNVSYIYRMPGIERLIRHCSDIVLEFGGKRLAQTIKSTHIHTLLRRFNKVACEDELVPPLSSDMRKRLQDVFADEIARLSVLIGKDLSHWK
jgi:hypothetical protein